METKAYYIENKIEELIYPLLFKIGFIKSKSDNNNFFYIKANITYIYKHHITNNDYHELNIDEVIHKGRRSMKTSMVYIELKSTVSNLSEIDNKLYELIVIIKSKFPKEIRQIKIKNILNDDI